jgi:hypothetical protein
LSPDRIGIKKMKVISLKGTMKKILLVLPRRLSTSLPRRREVPPRNDQKERNKKLEVEVAKRRDEVSSSEEGKEEERCVSCS